MALHEEALRVVNYLGDEASYETIQEALTRRYSPPEQITAFKSAFRNRKQKRGESATAFAYELRELAHRAYPNEDSLPEAWLIDQFCNGLLREDTRVHVECQDPPTLQAALSAAETYEAIKNKGKSADAAEVNLVKTSEAGAGELPELVATMKKLCEEMSASAVKSQERRAKYEKAKAEKLCFICGDDSHFKVDCPLNRNKKKPKKAEEPNGQLNSKRLD